MAKEQKQDIVVGLDLGTTKVCTIIGEQDDDGQVHIIGVGTTPSTGLKKGSVVNIEQTIASIKKSVQDAERMAVLRHHNWRLSKLRDEVEHRAEREPAGDHGMRADREDHHRREL